MIREILLGLVIAVILLYLYYLYLKWADEWTGKHAKYTANARSVTKSDAEYITTYGWALPPEPIADGFKVVNFWMKYYTAYIPAML